jgi:uncharacterized protein
MDGRDRIVVVGRAERAVAPDGALLTVRVVDVDDDRRAAFRRCGARVNDVVERLRAVVGRDGDVTTGQVSLELDHEAFERDRASRQHAASCLIDVDCDPARAGDVVVEAVESGVDRLSGPRYLLRDGGGVTEQLLAEAVAVARRKAERLAAAADGSLGAVVAIEELREDGMAQAAAGGRRIDLVPASISVVAAVRVAFTLAGPAGRTG